MMYSHSNGKLLYAVCYEEWIRGQWVSQIDHLHAECQGHARILFTAGNSAKILAGRLHIAEIGISLGFSEDATGLYV